MLVAVFTLSVAATSASAAPGDAELRFVHAVPGVGEAEISVEGETVGTASFSDASPVVPVPAGTTDLDLQAPDGVELTASPKLEAGQGYLVVAMPKGDSAEMRVFEDESAKAGLARLRMIHAAPELGDADLAVNGDVVAEEAGYSDQTDYLDLEPGRYELAVQAPDTGDPVLSGQVALASGTSSTALVVGSQGEKSEVVLVEDDSAKPSAAPDTGFGGLSGEGSDWGLAVLAAAFAGLLGLAFARRRGSASPPR